MPGKRPFKLPDYQQDQRGPGNARHWRAALSARLGEAVATLEAVNQTPRQVLGIARDQNDWTEIRKVYRKLARENHPDHHPGDDVKLRRFQRISAAYTILENAAGLDRLATVN